MYLGGVAVVDALTTYGTDRRGGLPPSCGAGLPQRRTSGERPCTRAARPYALAMLPHSRAWWIVTCLLAGACASASPPVTGTAARPRGEPATCDEVLVEVTGDALPEAWAGRELFVATWADLGRTRGQTAHARIDAGTVRVACVGGVAPGAAYPGATLWVDLDGDAQCGAGDVVWRWGSYVRAGGVRVQLSATATTPQRADVFVLAPELGSAGAACR